VERDFFHSNILPSSFLIFRGKQKCEIWTQFSTQLPFESLAFRNEVRYLKFKTNVISVDDGTLSSPNVVHFVSGTLENRP